MNTVKKQVNLSQLPGRGGFHPRHKVCPLSGPQAPQVTYKDPKLLRRYISEQGKIIPARISAVKAKKQRELAKAIKRARHLALLSYTGP